MENSFFSNSTNFVSATQGSVDPRTGLFGVNIPLANLRANKLLGPSIELSLTYSALSTQNIGFGKGFRLNLSSYNPTNGKLLLSSGEEYRVDVNGNLKQKKLNNFIFEKANDNECRIIHKAGLIENLVLERGNIYVPYQITSADGRKLHLKWSSEFSPARLTQITDDYDNFLCIIHYPDEDATTRLTCLLLHLITFQFQNELLKRVSSNATDPELIWSFDYDDIGPQHRYKNVIVRIISPTGLVEEVKYYTQNGIEFPSLAQLPALPCVFQYKTIPGNGQPAQVSHWEYTPKNYLGRDANFNSWHPNEDEMLKILLNNYEYGSTSKTINETTGEVHSTITRLYNSYHLLTSETAVRDGKTYVKDSQYYAIYNEHFDKQPEQYMLPKKVVEKWFDERKPDDAKSDTIDFEFDISGNPTRQISSNGTVTEYTYYEDKDDEDCPADPFKFIRYIKTQTTKPPQISKKEPTTIVHNTWQKLDVLNGHGYYVIPKTIQKTVGETITHTTNTYNMDRNNSLLYGRLVRREITITPNNSGNETFTTSETFTYECNENSSEIAETIEFTGHDKLKVSKKSYQNFDTGNTTCEISPQGVPTNYEYDILGRILKKTRCIGTEYENSVTYEYKIDENGPFTLETDIIGNKSKIFFDGIGRLYKRVLFNIDTSEWFEIFSCSRDSSGECVTGTVKDWTTENTIGNNTNHRMKADITYDGWGGKSIISFSDGRKENRIIDPVQLENSTYLFGNNTTLRTSSETTIFDKQSKLPICKKLKDTSGDEYSFCQYSWDGLGRLLTERNELGNITERTYDEYGRVLTQKLPDNTIICRIYSPHLTGNNVSSISVTGLNANNETQTWLMGTQKFDSLGRVNECNVGGRTTTFSYEGSSPVPATVKLPSGKTKTYTYIPELNNAISMVTADDITQTFTYDKVTGKRLTASEADATTKNVWSASGDLKEQEFSRNNQIRRSKFCQTLKGAPIAYTDITGKETRYTLDSHGRIITVFDDDGLTADLTYDSLSRLSTKKIMDIRSNTAIINEFKYDDKGRETMRTIKDSKGPTIMVFQTWLKNNLLATRVLKMNNLIIRSERYIYDNRNRLIDYCVCGDSLPSDAYGNKMTKQIYAYDALNNITSVDTILFDGTIDKAIYQHSNVNDPTQLMTISHTHVLYPKSIQLEYDNEGRMIRDEAERTLTYDVMGRLTSVVGKGTYNYDATDKLITQQVKDGDTHELFYRDTELVNEVFTSMQCEIRLIKHDNACIGLSDHTGTTLIATDQNNSSLWSHNTLDSEVELHSWSPYGIGAKTTTNSILGFNGERIDPVSGTYHLGNGYRAYNPVLMRFDCPDSLSPFGAGGINPYAYCAGDPINRIDPSGHLNWQAIIEIIFGVIGIGLSIFSAGISIAAAGGIVAAITASSTPSLVAGTLSIISDITGIASSALENQNPKASDALGWISLATSLAGVGIGNGKRISAGKINLITRNGANTISYSLHENIKAEPVPSIFEPRPEK